MITPVESVDILDVRVIQQNSYSNNFNVNLGVNPSDWWLNFDYVDEENGVVLQVVHTGKGSSDVELKGRIIGNKRIKRRPIDVVRHSKLVERFLGENIAGSSSKLAHVFGPPILALAVAGFMGRVMVIGSIGSDPVRVVDIFDVITGSALIIAGAIYWVWSTSVRWQNRLPRGLEFYAADFLTPSEKKPQ
jgi:hypothetical protein